MASVPREEPPPSGTRVTRARQEASASPGFDGRHREAAAAPRQPSNFTAHESYFNELHLLEKDLYIIVESQKPFLRFFRVHY